MGVDELNKEFLKSLLKGSIPVGVLTAGAVSQIGEEEAEAMPGTLIPKIAKSLLRGPSSAAPRLKGMIHEGKRIIDVQTGPNPWRYLIYEDGSGLPVTKDEVNALSRQAGTEMYVKRFQKASDDIKLTQAIRSLEHEPGADPSASILSPRKRAAMYRASHERKLKALNIEPSATSGVWFKDENGRRLYRVIPQEYADFLEKKGIVQVDRKGGK